MTGFDPCRKHGMTWSFNRITQACAITTSTYIWESFAKALVGIKVEHALEGTGADTE